MPSLEPSHAVRTRSNLLGISIAPLLEALNRQQALIFCVGNVQWADLSAIGLFALSYANNGISAFLAATVFGLGIVYFWPTMLGVTAERFPRGGAFLLGLMGCVGNLAVATNLFVMGGTNNGTGNVTPAAQYNFYVDPEAAKIVIAAGFPLKLVYWSLCLRSSIFGDAMLQRKLFGN